MRKLTYLLSALMLALGLFGGAAFAEPAQDPTHGNCESDQDFDGSTEGNQCEDEDPARCDAEGRTSTADTTGDDTVEVCANGDQEAGSGYIAGEAGNENDDVALGKIAIGGDASSGSGFIYAEDFTPGNLIANTVDSDGEADTDGIIITFP